MKRMLRLEGIKILDSKICKFLRSKYIKIEEICNFINEYRMAISISQRDK